MAQESERKAVVKLSVKGTRKTDKPRSQSVVVTPPVNMNNNINIQLVVLAKKKD